MLIRLKYFFSEKGNKYPFAEHALMCQYNPILKDGEILVIDIDRGTLRYVIGDGESKYVYLDLYADIETL